MAEMPSLSLKGLWFICHNLFSIWRHERKV